MNNYNDLLITLLKQSEIIASEYNSSYVTTFHFLVSILLNDNSLCDVLSSNGINYDSIKKFLIKEKSNNIYFLYSREFLNVIDDVIMSDDLVEIDASSVLIKALEDNNSEISKTLSKLNVDKPSLIRDLKIKNNCNTKLIIKDLSINMNDEVTNNNVDPVIGRDKDIDRIIEILSRKNKNNPLLVGEAGCGKTAIIEELSRRIVNNKVPSFLKNKIIYNLNLANVIAGTKYRGEFEEKFTKIISELENNDDIILFIDEIHTIMGAGGAEGAIDASNIIKPALARGKVKIIGATTTKEYKNSIEKDGALNRRFQKVNVNVPSSDETYVILKKIKSKYETYHGVSVSDSMIKRIVYLSDKYIKDKNNPDKSIDILDEVCSSSKIMRNKKRDSINDKISELINKKNYYLKLNSFNEAVSVRSKIKYLEDIRDNNTCKLKTRVNNKTLKKVLEEKTNSTIYELVSKKYFINKVGIAKRKYNFKNLDSFTVYLYNVLTINNSAPRTIFIGDKKTFIDELLNILNINKICLDGANFSSYASIYKLVGNSSMYDYNDNKNILFESIRYKPVSAIYITNYVLLDDSIKKLISSIISSGKITLYNNEVIDARNIIFIFNESIYDSPVGFYNNNITSSIKFDYCL